MGAEMSRLSIPFTPLTVLAPDGWEAMLGPKGVHICAPGIRGVVETDTFVGTNAGEFSLLLVPAFEDGDLDAVCKRLWTRRTGVAASHCEVARLTDSWVAFEWTDGVHDIVSWILRPSAAQSILLEIQYAVSAFIEPTLTPDERAEVLNSIVSSLRLDGAESQLMASTPD